MNQVYSVSEINNYIKDMFRRDRFLGSVAVRGEASNVKYHTSGHIYFTLKDESGQMSCVMFARERLGLTFRLEEGLGIIVVGQVSVYERDGRYQIYAREILMEGKGKLYEQYERLKKKLEIEGLFEAEHKKSIPSYPKSVGIVTASTGAAIRDIINISSRRNPYVQLVLSPSLVQGDAAPESIVRALKRLIKYKPDTIIIGRGGGSIEDLWAFNDESVARAIFECPIPIISAVGHETDFTIADFVSDLRAPTPSAAAELAVGDIMKLSSELVDARYDLYRAMSVVIQTKRREAELISARLRVNSPTNRIALEKQTIVDLSSRLSDDMRRLITLKRHTYELLLEKLDGLSPAKKLKGGFSYVSDVEGNPVTSIASVKPEDFITVNMSDGILKAKVVDKSDWRM